MKIATIYFIAVNFNNAKYTIEYVKSILKIKTNEIAKKIIIVDNGSEIHDQRELINQLQNLREVELIFANKNLGYFKGLNEGILKVNLNEETLVLIGNNDLTFETTFIEEINKVEIPENAFILAPDVVTINGIHQNPLCIKRMSLLRKYGLRFYYTNYYYGRTMYHLIQMIKRNVKPNKKINKAQFIYMGIGACYILTPDFFKHFKKLREDVFLWSEEALLAGQINDVGGKMLYCPTLIVHHAENTSVKKIPSKKTYEMARESFLKTFHYY